MPSLYRDGIFGNLLVSILANVFQPWTKSYTYIQRSHGSLLFGAGWDMQILLTLFGGQCAGQVRLCQCHQLIDR
jgi:hypothetical protein